MSNHSPEHDPEMSEHFKKMFSQGRNDYLKKLEELNEKLGATGNFPHGKLTEKDEGEIRFAITSKDGRVVIDFGQDITWLGMLPEQAINLGELLIKHGKEIKS